jgi:hypothetical protein
MIKPGDWVKHPKIEQVMHVDRIDEALKRTGRPTAPPAPAQPFEEAPW